MPAAREILDALGSDDSAATDVVTTSPGPTIRVTCLLCDGALQEHGTTAPSAVGPCGGRMRCRDCHAEHDTARWIAPVLGSPAPILGRPVAAAGSQLRVSRTAPIERSGYRKPAPAAIVPFVARFRATSLVSADGRRGAKRWCLLVLAALALAAAAPPTAWALLLATLVTAVAAFATSHRAAPLLELRAGDGRIALRRLGPLRAADAPQSARRDEIPPTRVAHVALFARPFDRDCGLVYYGVRVTDGDGASRDYPISSDLAVTRMVYRLLRGEIPASAKVGPAPLRPVPAPSRLMPAGARRR